MEKIKRFLNYIFLWELIKGLWIVFKVMIKDRSHTLLYPLEKLPISNRYRGVHRINRLLESGNSRCIGCGLCEKICPANCIRIEAGLGEDGRKQIKSYTINLGRCLFCGFCAEVCPELAIVHTNEYEATSTAPNIYIDYNNLLTPIDKFKENKQKEFMGFGAVQFKAKATPIRFKNEEEVKEERC